MTQNTESPDTPGGFKLFDHVLILNQAHARQLLATYQRHYNNHRPHQTRNQLPPNTDQQPATIHDLQTHKVQHTHILDSLINEYRLSFHPEHGHPT
jgi:putative transposase